MGSISHTDEVVAAVVALSPLMHAVGVDVDENEPLDDAAMVELVCRPDELIQANDPSQAANLQHGKLLFVIKEAIHKLVLAYDADMPGGFMMSGSRLPLHGGLQRRTRLSAVAGDCGKLKITGRFAEVGNLYVALALSRF